MEDSLSIMGVLSEKAKSALELEGDDWVFVDYPPKEIKLGKYGLFEIHEIVDQLHGNLSVIPTGWLTVCRVSGIDKSILPVQHAWYENEGAIKIPV